ncbi:MAG: hypothetical protein R6V53_04770 [Candidatus Woesearchaeota archaeon]
MDKIFTTHFTVGNPKKPKDFTLDDIISTVKEWVLTKRENEFGNLDFSHEINRWRKDRCYVSILNFTDEEKRHFTMRYAHPGFNDTDEFITDIVLLQDDEISMSTVLQYGDKNVSPKSIPRTKPRIISDVVNKFGATKGDLPLPSRAINPSYVSIDHVAHILQDTRDKREYPIVYVSRDNFNQVHIDPEKLFNKMKGIGALIVEPDKEFGEELQSRMPWSHRCFGGAVRVYWSDDNYNRFWTKQTLTKIKEKHYLNKEIWPVEQVIFNHIIENLNYQTLPMDLRYDLIRLKHSKKHINDMKASGSDWEEIAGCYATDNDILRDQLDKISRELDSMKHQNYALKQKLAEKEDKTQFSTEVQARKVKFNSLTDAVDDAAQRYDRLIIPDKVMKQVKECEFRRYDKVYLALEWLATTYHEFRTSPAPMQGVDLNGSCYSYSGFNYKKKQHPITTRNKKFASDYEIEYDGKVYELQKHLAIGNQKDPKKTLRIAFEYDPDPDVIIIGYLGTHQQSKLSK